MERETFKSRLGFILISAGCAIGIGNVWRFPYVVGNNGGGIFVLIYIFFLIVLGIPVMSMEFSVGRASRKSIVKAYTSLEKPGTKWHFMGYASMIGNYLLMMYYTTVAGWMLYYCFATATGKLSGLDASGITQHFSNLTGSPVTMIIFTFIVITIGFLICSLGLQNGVEKITKPMMLALLAIMVILAINSLTIDGGAEGLKFYLYPDIAQINKIGWFRVIVAAMNQAFFTLSLGIGSMLIFGSYQSDKTSIIKESSTIAALDTFVAITAGLIIFPACFAFGVNPDSGESLVFITLPNIFNSMPLGRLWGSLFFLFMTFAAFSTVIAVFENICSITMDIWSISRKKASVINIFVLFITSLPCIFGYNILSNVKPFGQPHFLAFEDYLVSNILLPIGSLILVLFCTWKGGWGIDNYFKEVNKGDGPKLSRRLIPYLKYVIPVIILIVFLSGIIG
ncbi:MAG: sodium-dependent transporter [Lachnospiraceae bacterium]|nr:sodium-dependent transporter [Lachnospiraceae bacterium]